MLASISPTLWLPILSFLLVIDSSLAWVVRPLSIRQRFCSVLNSHQGVVLAENGKLVGTHATSPRQWLESQPNGAYTVLRCEAAGTCQGLDFHMDRLQDSFQRLMEIQGNATPAEDITTQAAAVLHELTTRGMAYLDQPGAVSPLWMVTLLVYNSNNKATVQGHLYHLAKPIPSSQSKSLTVALMEGPDLPSRQPCPQAKLSSWCTDRKPLEELQNVNQADDTILLGPDGCLLEGLTSNLFVVRSDGILQTAPSHLVLPGYMRHRVLASGVFQQVSFAPIYPEDAATAWKGLFLTSSVRIVSPVHKIVRIDSEKKNSASEVVWTASLHDAEEIDRLCRELRTKVIQTSLLT